MLGLICSIWCLWNGRTRSNFCISQSEEPSSIRSATVRVWNSSGGGSKGLDCSNDDSQRSLHTLIAVPEPTIQPSYFLNRFLPINIPLHPWDAAFVGLIVKNGSSLQYFPKKRRARRHVGFFRILQLSFARSASLKVKISLNPNPPSFFGLAIFFRTIHDTFLMLLVLSHQNLVNTDWISAQRVRGSLKHDIAKEGIVAMTVLNMINFPARERNFVDQQIDLCLILSTILENKNLFFLPNCSGRPKYLPNPPSFSMPSTCLIWILHSWFVLSEKEMTDFCAFISWPETDS